MVDGNKVRDNEIAKKKNYQKISKFQKMSKSKKMIRFLGFLIFGTKLAFTKLKQVFVKIPILYHFDPEYHIQIEIDILGYTIDRIPS